MDSKLKSICQNCQRCAKHCFHEKGCRVILDRYPCLECSKGVVIVSKGKQK